MLLFTSTVEHITPREKAALKIFPSPRITGDGALGKKLHIVYFAIPQPLLQY